MIAYYSSLRMILADILEVTKGTVNVRRRQVICDAVLIDSFSVGHVVVRFDLSRSSQDDLQLDDRHMTAEVSL